MRTEVREPRQHDRQPTAMKGIEVGQQRCRAESTHLPLRRRILLLAAGQEWRLAGPTDPDGGFLSSEGHLGADPFKHWLSSIGEGLTLRQPLKPGAIPEAVVGSDGGFQDGIGAHHAERSDAVVPEPAGEAEFFVVGAVVTDSLRLGFIGGELVIGHS